MDIQDNVAVIRKAYAAFGAGAIQTILDQVHDKAEWVNHGPRSIPYAGSRRGKAEIREFFHSIADTTTGAKVLAENFIAAGDAVVVTGRYEATVKDTGARIDTPIAHIFIVRDRKIVRWEGFSDTAHVAEAHKGKAAAGR